MNVNDVRKLIEFSRDWNTGMSVKEMASKYGVKEASIRSRVSSLRKKGVKLASRKGGLALTEQEVAKINAALK